MPITPFLKPIRVSGGSFYTFPSSAEDITFTFNNSDTKITFSKFVLLNLPNLQSPTNFENYLQLDAIPGAFPHVNSITTDPNINFAESFQNYCMNLEEMLLAQDSYNPDSLQTVTERVFFKWLKETGSLRFREANSNEVYNIGLSGQRFVEEDSSPIYSRVVQYIGNIDVTNTAKVQGSTQAELYLHVPNEVGSTPYTLFYSNVNDTNYKADTVLINNPSNSLYANYILGRTGDETHPSGLNYNAFFDSPIGDYSSSTFKLQKKIDDVYTDDKWWFTGPIENSYYLEPTILNDPRNDDLKIVGLGSKDGIEVEFRRSRLDGIGIDFDLLNYQASMQNSTITSWPQFNTSSGSSTFDFNVVLVYYDVYKVSDPTQRATNLYGVLFLDNLEFTSEGGSKISRFTKNKPSKSANLNGNSYGFRINLRLDTNTEDAAVEASINTYNTMSMELYNEALTILKETADLIQNSSINYRSLEDRISSLEDLINNTERISTLETKMDDIEEKYKTSSAYFENAKSLVDLINRNYKEILNIYNNKTSVQVEYNLDILKPGTGISIEKKGGKFYLNNTREGYSINPSNIFTKLEDYDEQTPTSYNYYKKLLPGTNYILFKEPTGESFITDRNINLYIDDSENNFEMGQIIKVSFGSILDLDGADNLSNYTFNIYTDSLNKSNKKNKYECVIANITANSFTLSNNQPYFEIICLDPQSYEFSFEKIR